MMGIAKKGNIKLTKETLRHNAKALTTLRDDIVIDKRPIDKRL